MLIIAGIVILICVLLTIGIKLKKKPDQLITSATLTEAIDISELSTAQFTYNGIAEVYKDEKKEKIECYIKYNAKVNAGIDMKLVEFEISEENKTVKPILPEITLTSTLITENVENFSFIPENTKIELNEIISICKADAEQESLKSNELFKMAEDNLKNTIEALIYPIIDVQGYRVIWE